MEKVAVYACFKKKNKHSISYYIKRTNEWCLMKNYDCTFYVDKVQDRDDLKNRKELESLKDDIKNNEYSKIIIINISHLSRDSIANAKFIDFVLNNGCDIECIDGTDLKVYKKIVEEFSKKIKEEKRK